MKWTDTVSTLVDLLQWRAREQSDRVAYVFTLENGEEERMTYAELDFQARKVAASLQPFKGAGERALLLYPPGLTYISAFFGCLYAGVIPVPAYPPRTNGNLGRLQAIIVDAQARFALTHQNILSHLMNRFADYPVLAGVTWMITEELGDELAHAYQPEPLTSESLAFLQYTSGSTSLPKGVMLTHSNLLHNLQLIERHFGTSAESKGLIWLPPYHDMGLIGGILNPLYSGYPVTLMAPVDFIQRPHRWLELIASTQATVSGGPNFAYELCLQKIKPEQRETLDLSSWQLAFSGAEPVRYASLKRFAEAFAPYGFRREAFYPCYGLAEATLFVSGGMRGERPVAHVFDEEALQANRAIRVQDADDSQQPLVSCGRVELMEQKIRIVSADACTLCADGEVGEIWVSGPSIAKGYWNRPEQTAEVFQARLTGGGTDAFLRTGDLGFVHEGELYVTGRIKDILIIRGRNYYPQDLEFTVQESHPAVHNSNGAAFAIQSDGEERVVIVQEIERVYRKSNLQEVVDTVRRAIAEEHQLQVWAVVLIKPASIPKTSSGKVQRHACKERFLNETLDVVFSDLTGSAGPEAAALTNEAVQPAEWQADREALLALEPEQRAGTLLQDLVRQAGRVLRMEPERLVPEQALTAYGLDSLMAVQLKQEVEDRFEVTLPLSSLLEGISLAGLADEVCARLEEGEQVGVPAVTDAAPTEFALSSGQQAMWFLQRLAPESAAYNVSHAVKFVSAVDLAVLKQAFYELVKRHSLLRMNVRMNGDSPVQRVRDEADVAFTAELAFAWDEAQLAQRLHQEANRPFRLEEEPLLRVFVFQREEPVMLLVAHHIICDFWSFEVLFRELCDLYAALRLGVAPQLPERGMEYAEYVAAQQRMLTSPAGRSRRQYWMEQLSGELPVLHLPTDQPRPREQSFQGAVHSFALPADLARHLKRVAQEHNVTVYVALLAAFQVFLYRCTGQNDILVGSPALGRQRAREMDVIGYFVNSMPLRARMDGELTFAEHLKRVQKTVVDALAHSDDPFPALVEDLQLKRDPSYPPVFQTFFTYQKSHLVAEDGLNALALGKGGVRFRSGDLLLDTVGMEQRWAQFDLALTMAEMGGTLEGQFVYCTDLFHADTVERWAQHFVRLLTGIAEDCAQTLAQLPVLTEQERRLVLEEWNETGAAFDLMTVPRWIEAQAARTPDRVAVRDEQRSLTYAELNARANALAHRLCEQGVGREMLVGLCVERSVEMVAGVLGILKAGAAYLPLDPAFPHERIAYLLEDTELRFLISERAMQDRVSAHQGLTIWMEDLDRPEETQIDFESEASLDGLAYVIYTSGSTGRPKGTEITHRALSNFLYAMREQVPVSAGDRLAAVTTLSFDIAGLELFLPLMQGAEVIVVSRSTAADGARLAQMLTDSSVTVMQATPATWYLLLQAGWEPQAGFKVLCGGEAFPRDLLSLLLKKQADVWNLYGPTEATIWTTAEQLVSAEAVITVGRPLANVQTYVLDERLQPVPIGVHGELHIGGAGLARGYWRRPELTADKFIMHSFDGETTMRLYKTGDVARFLPDGSIEVLGRMDHQVKVRGYRIELGEIESVLEQHPAVRRAVVIVWEDDPVDKKIVAYVAPLEEQTLRTDDLRELASRQLPAYMLPSAWVIVDEIPLTANGKVDRKSLPSPDQAGLSGTVYVAPRTEREAAIAAIWSDLLHVEQVGVLDNFFESGGHSLKAAQLLTRLQQQLGYKIPLGVLFERPTVAALSAWIESAEAVAPAPAPVIVPVSREEQLPLSYAQQRLWALDQLDFGSTAYHMPYALRLNGDLHVTALEQALNGIVLRHEALRTRFVQTEEGVMQQISPALWMPLQVEDLSAYPVLERESLMRKRVEQEFERAFDLSTGPMIRFNLLRLGEQEHVLVLNMHHIVSDGWSIGVFVEEFVTLYRAFISDNPAELPKLPIQYADYALWQREWLQGEDVQAQLAYWKQRLSGELPVLQLPLDHPRPPVQSSRGAVETFVIRQEQVDRLHELSRQQGTTLFMTMLAAFQTLLHRYSGQDEICVGTPVAGRRVRETEGLIGLFVNTLVMRQSFPRAMTFRDLLNRTREVALGAYEHQDVPFEWLVDVLQPRRDMSRSPLFQVMFDLQEDALDGFELPGLQAQPVEIATGTAKFDLSLTMLQRKDGLAGQWEYGTDLFAPETMRQMIRHFENVLTAIAADPDCELSAIPMLSAEERQQMVSGWREAELPGAAGCLHQVFERQAERRPEHSLIVCGEQTLTYAEVNCRANRLARYLLRRGIRAESLVGICLDRSPEMIVAVLGVLKAGGAYVPIDPAYPQERVTAMLDACELSLLIKSSDINLQFPVQEALLFDLDLATAALGEEEETNPAVEVYPEQLAYVIFTSGTTGKPKGVMVQHDTLLAVGAAWQQEYRLKQMDVRLLQVASFSFDVYAGDLVRTFVSGGTLVICPADTRFDVPELTALMQQQRITMVESTPGLLIPLMDYVHIKGLSLPDLQLVIIGSDTLLATDYSRLLARFGSQMRILNSYGITEATIDSSYYEASSASAGALSAGVVPIGRPLPNTRFYILDAHHQPVPVGVPGELYIAGRGVARGYYCQPELTSERFLADPFHAGGRMYKTGDLSRWRGDGVVEFLGRQDQQVKIRGYRVETGDIEAQLQQHADVQEAVVVAWEGGPVKRLVAYVTAREGAEMDERVLRDHLKERLPEYMVPAVFVLLDQLPLSPNGKVDRRALPAPIRDESSRDAEMLMPRTEMEQVLADVWCEVLRLERVGVRENFFEQGGDSILAIQMISRLNQRGVRLSSRDVFHYQTIAELANVAKWEAASHRAEQGVVSGDVRLTPIQHWFFGQEFADADHWNLPLLLEVSATLDVSALREAVAHLMQHHDALRMRYDLRGTDWVQINGKLTEEVPLHTVDLSGAGDAEAVFAEQVAQWQSSLCLSEGPVVRFVYFDCGTEARGRLLIVLHHLIADGLSWRMLLEDLERAYRAAASGQPIRLPRKSLSFRQWAELLAQHADAPETTGELAYWQSVCETEMHPLPLDRPDGSNVEATGEPIRLTLSEAETSALLADVSKAYNTRVQDVLLTALTQAFAKWTGQSRLHLNLEGHGREEIADGVDVSRTVGWFTTVFPVCLSVRGSDDPGADIKQVKEQLRRIPRRGIGYGLLRYQNSDPDIRAALANQPVPQVTFNYLGQFDQAQQEGAVFAMSLLPSGPARGGTNGRAEVFEINCGISGGRLVIEWTYSTALHERSTAERVAHSFVEALRGLIGHCLAVKTVGYTTSDFPQARLQQAALDSFLHTLQQQAQDAPLEIEQVYELSPVQQGMLYHSLLDPDAGAYMPQLSLRLHGPLHAEAMRRAWQAVVDHHPILRTSFHWEGLEHPLQVVHRQAQIPLDHLNWQHAAPGEQQIRMQALQSQDARQRFDLAKAPLMRLTLIKLGEEEHCLLWTTHHLVLDGWSMPLLMQDLFRLYDAYADGQTLRLDSQRPYHDFVTWLQQQDLQEAESYWRQTLQGITAPTSLGIERVAAESAGHTSHIELENSLPGELTSDLQRFARTHQVTLNTMINAAWGLLLHRYSGEEDVVFGVTVSGRPSELAGVETMVGLFINTLPMRSTRRDGQVTLQYLQDVQRRQLELRQYEYAPLLKVQEWSDVPRGNPLFDTILVFENYPMDESVNGSFGGLRVQDIQAAETTNYPITLAVIPGERLTFKLLYDQQRYEARAMQNLLRHLEQLLREMVQKVDQPLAALAMVTPDEQARLLQAWSGAQGPLEESLTLVDVFAHQAVRRSECIALSDEQGEITYRQLDQLSGRVAQALRHQGIGSGQVVGVMAERCMKQVVALLGVLKSGAAYLPIDPEYPEERIRYMLENSGADLLLVQSSRVGQADAFGVQTAIIDRLTEQEAAERADWTVHADDPVYLIYTSGSTGTPKGVPGSHRALLNLLRSSQALMGYDEDDVILSMTSYSFDAFQIDWVFSLLSGGRMHIVGEEGRYSLQGYAEAVARVGATRAFLPTAVFRHFGLQLTEVEAAQMRTLRSVLIGGEALPPESVNAWQQQLGDSLVILNGYGPIEAGIFCLMHPIRETLTHGVTRLPIGHPLLNIQAYVLSPDGHLCPEYVTGELHIASPGVAQGYWRQPERTAQSFLPNPYSSEWGGRFYKTGDLVRTLPDGELEYRGRRDDQVKIRGFRIEPDEVRNVLLEHPEVREAVVIVRADSRGEQRLCAYLVMNGVPLSGNEWRRDLKRRLPEYMIPSAFVCLEEIPMTANGKVDHRALPRVVSSEEETDYVAPRTPLEQQIAQIWAEVLHVQRIGVHDHFFDAGGHSLMATQVISRIRAELQVELPLRSLIDAPVLAEFAQFLEQHVKAGTHAASAAIKGRSREAYRRKR